MYFLLQTVFAFNPYEFELNCPISSCEHINQWYHESHHAIDFDGEVGDPVYAAGRGVVYKAGWNCLTIPCAKAVTILHNNGTIATNYWHLDEVNVEKGDSVDRGDVIGTIGMTGITTGPHLHFSIQVNREFVDPDLFIDCG